jgi:site-specific DNA recombinase
MTAPASPIPRAIGIVRVSETKGREGDSFHSPDMQRQRIEQECARNGWRLLRTVEELDVSASGPSLARRTGLGPAVSAIEAGEADVIVVAYFDRLFRNMAVQLDVMRRVEEAGGELVPLDTGKITNGGAAVRMTSNFLGAVAQYHADRTAEAAGEAQRRAVERGVLPFPSFPPGYVRGPDGVLQRDPNAAPIVAQAFEMRANGATVKEVRAYLAEHGIERGYHGVLTMLSSRIVLGEIRFGQLANLRAHPAIVDREMWARVQRVRVPRGRRAKSDRLLARLGVLRCGTCGSRLSAGTARSGAYTMYRCPPNSDCPDHVTISAPKVEQIVEDAVREALADAEGRASAEAGIREADEAVERAQGDLSAALRAFVGLEDEPGAVERLGELRAARDEAQARRDQLGRGQVLTITAGADWDRLKLNERRGLIRATVERVDVAPGRGPDRVAVRFVGQQAAGG